MYLVLIVNTPTLDLILDINRALLLLAYKRLVRDPKPKPS